jgi:hypothetical protein
MVISPMRIEPSGGKRRQQFVARKLVSRNEGLAGNSLLVITVPAGTDRVTRNTPEASP